jgi:hypothetical protein
MSNTRQINDHSKDGHDITAFRQCNNLDGIIISLKTGRNSELEKNSFKVIYCHPGSVS